MKRLTALLFLLPAFGFLVPIAEPLSRGAVRGPGGPVGDPLNDTPTSNYRAVQAEYGALWRDFRSSTENLRATIGATNAAAAAALTQIQTNALFLEAKWDAWFKSHNRPSLRASSDAYLNGLHADARLLNHLKKGKDERQILDGLGVVALDLQIKADNCRNSGDGLGKEIKVKVHTKADGQEIGGFEVFFVSQVMLDVKSAHDRFPRQSSPTDEKILSPGGYAFWVRKKGFSSQPVALAVGGHGEKQTELDLEVPAP